MSDNLSVDGSIFTGKKITMDYTPQTTRMERCLPNLRWSAGILQQAWQVEITEGLAFKSANIEWRDVPTETV